MKITEKEVEGVLVIHIEQKDANLSVADTFRDFIFEKITAGKTHIVISFKQVEYVDSSFLGALVAVLKKILPLNGKLILAEVNSDIHTLFELTRLDKVFILKPSLNEALKEF